MARPTTVKRPKWRNIPDEVILALVPQQLERAESLCPSASTVERACMGDSLAIAITEAWRPVFPITELP
jgi:hypothetical protein